MKSSKRKSSPLLEWAMNNPVTINLIMIIVIALGCASGLLLKREMFPPLTMDYITASVLLEHSTTPQQIDENIVQLIYPKLRQLQGIKKIESTAGKSYAEFSIELVKDADPEKVKNDVKNAIDEVYNLPKDILSKNVTIVKSKEHPIHIILSSNNKNEEELVIIAERVKREIQNKGIATDIYVYPSSYPEINIYASRDLLASKGLTIQELSRQIQAHNIDRGMGTIKEKEGGLLIKNSSRKYTADAIAEIPIRFPSKEIIILKDLIGKQNIVYSTFSEDRQITELNGAKAVIISIGKTHEDDTITLCDNIHNFIEELSLPEGVQASPIWDLSVFVKDRLNLIINNGLLGLLLLLFILALFLEWRIAFWAASGIAFAIIGTLAVLYVTGTSLNMISLFGFLIILGIIVDDAIVISENFFHYLQKGCSAKEAALNAVSEIKWPVIAMVTTTMIAFIPLFFLAGNIGKFMSILPVAIISALALSLFEALVILPVHLADHCGKKQSPLMRTLEVLLYPILRIISTLQKWTTVSLDYVLNTFLQPLVKTLVKYRYATVIFFLSFGTLVVTLVPAGIVKTSVFSKPEEDWGGIFVEFREGLPFEKVEKSMRQVENALNQTQKYLFERDGKRPVKDYFLNIGYAGTHQAMIHLTFFSASEGRTVLQEEFQNILRTYIPPLPSLVSLNFQGEGSGGFKTRPVALTLHSSNDDILQEAKEWTIKRFKSIPGFVDVDCSQRQNTPIMDVRKKQQFMDLQLTEYDLAQEIADRYQGIKIDNFFHNNQEVNVYVQSPINERDNLKSLHDIQLYSGLYLSQVADIDYVEEPQTVKRTNGKRSIIIGANVDKTVGLDATQARNTLLTIMEEEWSQLFPEVDWKFSGEQEEGSEVLDSMLKSFIPALLMIYFILATVFRSYSQPILIMIAIPFGFLGAILGHFLIDIPLSLSSGMGLISLSGIAINDSLVLIDCVNQYLRKGHSLTDAIASATRRRFRPILLTTLTTVVSMAPILLETSFQAQFLKPMVAALVFGLITSTTLILLLIPACYAILMDILKACKLAKSSFAFTSYEK